MSTLHLPVTKPPPARAVGGRVLLAEDDPKLARSFTRCLEAEGYEIVHVANGRDAIEKAVAGDYDVIIADVEMPEASGLEVLHVARAYHPDIPFIVMTGHSDPATAEQATADGALRFLVKPIGREVLVKAIGDAVRQRHAAHAAHADRANRRSGTMRSSSPPPDPLVMFERALTRLDLRVERIIHVRDHRTLARSLAVYSDDISRDEGATTLFDEAARLGCLDQARDAAYESAARWMADGDPTTNVVLPSVPFVFRRAPHVDPALAHLRPIAGRCIVPLDARTVGAAPVAWVRALRGKGFRLALDCVENGPRAWLPLLTHFCIMRLDAELTRGIAGSTARRGVVAELARIAREQGIPVIAHASEATNDQSVLASLGCTFVQGDFAG